MARDRDSTKAHFIPRYCSTCRFVDIEDGGERREGLVLEKASALDMVVDVG